MGFTPLDIMSVDDLGPVVLHVLLNKDAFLNKTLSVSGDKLTIHEVATVLNRYLAPKTFRYKQVNRNSNLIIYLQFAYHACRNCHAHF